MTLALFSTATLYDRDYCAWLQTTIAALKRQTDPEVDWVNLIEELEEMGRRERQALESNLEILLMHLLKYQFQPEQRSNSWKFTIREHRNRLHKALRDSPSLQPYLQAVFEHCYTEACALAADETGLAIKRFPPSSPFSLAVVLDRDFLPD